MHQNHSLHHSKSPTELSEVKKTHWTGESSVLVLLTAVDIVETLLGESHAKESGKFYFQKRNIGYVRRRM
jgi:hypothetical protein